MKNSTPTIPSQLQIIVNNFSLHESDKIDLVVHDTKLKNAYTYMLAVCTDEQIELANINILNAYEMTLHTGVTATQARRLCLLFMLSSVFSNIGEKMFTDAMFTASVRPLCLRYLGNIFGTSSVFGASSFVYLLRYTGNLFSKEETDQYLYRYVTDTKVFDEAIRFKQCVTDIRVMGLLAEPHLHYKSYKKFYNTLCNNMELGNNDNVSNTLKLFKTIVDKRLRNSIGALESRWGVYKSFAKKLPININRVSHVCFSMLLYELRETGEVVNLVNDYKPPTMLEKTTKLLMGFDPTKDNQVLIKELSSTIKYGVCLTTLNKIVTDTSSSMDEISVTHMNYAKNMIRVASMNDLSILIHAAFSRLEV